MNSLANNTDLLERQRLMFQIIHIVSGIKKWRLTLPNSILLMLLNSGVDPYSALSMPNNQDSPSPHSSTPLHDLVEMTSPDDPYVNDNQVILGRQLIEIRADVNARAGSKILALRRCIGLAIKKPEQSGFPPVVGR